MQYFYFNFILKTIKKQFDNFYDYYLYENAILIIPLRSFIQKPINHILKFQSLEKIQMYLWKHKMNVFFLQ